MAMKTLSAKNAAALDKDLMSIGAFSIDQLMELAGLSVSQAVFRVHPPSRGRRILVACGPGNNGGDGLVAARHLWHYGYKPTIYYPKQSKNDLYQRLTTQLKNLSVPFTEDFPKAIKETDHIIDAIFGTPPFLTLILILILILTLTPHLSTIHPTHPAPTPGFSFSGSIREPFPAIITALQETHLPITSVDAPSSWNIEDGPPPSGPGATFMPGTLGRHFVGGRFVSPDVAEKYDLDLPEYEGIDQVVEVGSSGQKL
ncbi:NAD(P)H-hydrate epimerase [Lachnellula willkommii]|uniref:NAD(P)H-hydrate epimerase n=1 Tax=Lachnellula willkommii TaxID=215461 RepID=A0A559MN44_9HELO|nr:NAD(P)H-hydrate epimerase [Lachnellula willkommii]